MAKIKIVGGNLDGVEIEGVDEIFGEFGKKLDDLSKTLGKGLRGKDKGTGLEKSIDKFSKDLLGKKLPSIDSTIAKPLKEIGLQSSSVVKGLGKFSSAFNGVIKAAGGWASILIEVIGVMTDIAGVGMDMFMMFEKGEKRLSSYIDKLGEATKKIPIIGKMISPLVGIFGSLTAELERYRDVQADLSESGASFGNNLALMNVAAAQTQMSLEEYASVVKQNSEALTKFGTVTTGALRFSAVSKELIPRLRNMGYSVKDINEQLPGVMEVFSAGATSRNMTDLELADTAHRLMVEMDAVSKLTGKNRKSLLDEQKKISTDAAFRKKMSEMTAEQQAAINAKMIQARAVMGEEMAEMIKLMVLGMVPMTTELQVFQATQHDAVESNRMFIDSVKSAGKAYKFTEAEAEKMDESTYRAVEQMSKNSENLSEIMSAASAGLGGTAGLILKQHQVLMQQELKNGEVNMELFKQKQKEARAMQKIENNITKHLNNFENQIALIYGMFKNKLLGPFLEQIAPTISILADQFISMMNNISSIAEVIARDFAADKWGDMIKPFISIMEESFKSLAPIFGKLTKIAAKIATIFGPIIEGIIVVLKPFLFVIEMVLDVFDSMLSALNTLVIGIRDLVSKLFGWMNKDFDEGANTFRKLSATGKMALAGQNFIEYFKQINEEEAQKYKKIQEEQEKSKQEQEKYRKQQEEAEQKRREAFKKELEQFWGSICTWFSDKVDAGKKEAETFGKRVSEFWEASGNWFKEKVDAGKKEAEVLRKNLNEIYDSLSNKAKELIDQIGPWFKKFCENVLKIREKIIEKLQSGISCITDKIKEIFEGTDIKEWVDTLTSVVKDLWNKFKDIASSWMNKWRQDKEAEKPTETQPPASPAAPAGAPAKPPASPAAPAAPAGAPAKPPASPAAPAGAPAKPPASPAAPAGAPAKPPAAPATPSTIPARPTAPSIAPAMPTGVPPTKPPVEPAMPTASITVSKPVKTSKKSSTATPSMTSRPPKGQGANSAMIPSDGRFKKSEDFLKVMAPYALLASKKLGGTVDPRWILGQWSTETGGGKYLASNFNYGGIKETKGFGSEEKLTEEKYTPAALAKAQKQGEKLVKVIKSPTDTITKGGKEVSFAAYHGMQQFLDAQKEGKIWVQVKSKFAKFKSPEDFVNGYVQTLKNPKYKQALKSATAEEFGANVGGVYATVGGKRYGELIAEFSKQNQNLQFAKGTIGMTGKAFENFGSGTTIQAHNLEGIFTPDQLKSIVNESQQRLSTEVVDKVSALITDNPLQKQMVSLLSQAVDALNKSNRINNTIASSI